MLFVLKSAADTLLLGRELGSLLAGGDLLTLEGDLGAGKTTLIQGIGTGLRVIDPVTSPTFTLVQEYRGRVPLFHIDPYRLNSPEDAESIGLYDYLDRDGVVAIEWASRIDPILPAERLSIAIMHSNDPASNGQRQIQLTAVGKRAYKILDQLTGLPTLQGLRAEGDAE